MKNIAIIGTAGRTKGSAAGKPMTKRLWEEMLEDAGIRFMSDIHVISGGAAWTDHLAVELFLNNLNIKALTLHLPAPFDFKKEEFLGDYGTAGGTANYYHKKFREVTGVNSLARIAEASGQGARISMPAEVTQGYGEMFARNDRVAKDATDGMLAYTWGEGDAPDDGGTVYTWKKHVEFHPEIRRKHVPLSIIQARVERLKP